jgi:hypothetical protein
MDIFLEQFARQLAPGVHVVLVLDWAGWHDKQALHVPDDHAPAVAVGFT